MRRTARTQARQWLIRPEDPKAGQLARSLKISPLLAQVLLNRGVTDVQSASVFLSPKLTQLIPPESMPGIAPAVARIKRAITEKEKITVYGDYDVDGITGVAILWQLLTLLGADVDYYIPHRIDEGYGLNKEAVLSLAEAGTKLIITVDCGTTAFASADLAGQLHLELIITDHHQPGPALPKAAAIVHPALDESYPNQDASGSMVAFKLAWAIANTFAAGAKLDRSLREFMLNATTLAAIGTIADVVDLRGENRILASYGLKSLPQCRLCGIRALIEAAGLAGQGLDSFHVGFRLAPMLNAAGRMGHARLAVELLTSDSEARSMQIAEYLKEQNSRRQQRERKIFEQACEMIAQRGFDQSDRRTIVLAGEDWHTGIIGIVASRIAEKFYRPTILINAADPENHIAQGSGRSIPGFSLLDAISACSENLVSFGGHKMAAGLTIESEKIPQFVAAFEAYAEQRLDANDLVHKLHIDAAAPLGGFKKETVAELQMLEPFGQGNPRPVFATKGVRLASPPRKVGAKSEHLQLAITDDRTAVRCIGFRFAEFEKKLLEHDFFDVAYQPQINNYNGSSNVEFVLADIQFE
ncbi:MAG TPA: single-stranded-DNA-specific exonuclease RecJ [Sedimentisphaerales bacterium]|nr:single-stranded-DNA-specific exonuclease RecJ [Sedimentisphaerales bacterium]